MRAWHRERQIREHPMVGPSTHKSNVAENSPRTFARYSDGPKVSEILQGIKAALKDVPNVDLLSPFRVHLIDFAETGLKIQIVCYFATKSFDEFLYLQQLGLMETARVVSGLGATMTSVLSIDMVAGEGAVGASKDHGVALASSLAVQSAIANTASRQQQQKERITSENDSTRGSHVSESDSDRNVSGSSGGMLKINGSPALSVNNYNDTLPAQGPAPLVAGEVQHRGGSV